MIASTLTRIGFVVLIASTLIILVVFGTLGISVQNCNIETWTESFRPLLGEGFMGSVNRIWNFLFLILLLPLFCSIKEKGRTRVALAVWSSLALLILIAIRSAELAPNC